MGRVAAFLLMCHGLQEQAAWPPGLLTCNIRSRATLQILFLPWDVFIEKACRDMVLASCLPPKRAASTYSGLRVRIHRDNRTMNVQSSRHQFVNLCGIATFDYHGNNVINISRATSGTASKA